MLKNILVASSLALLAIAAPAAVIDAGDDEARIKVFVPWLAPPHKFNCIHACNPGHRGFNNEACFGPCHGQEDDFNERLNKKQTFQIAYAYYPHKAEEIKALPNHHDDIQNWLYDQWLNDGQMLPNGIGHNFWGAWESQGNGWGERSLDSNNDPKEDSDSSDSESDAGSDSDSESEKRSIGHRSLEKRWHITLNCAWICHVNSTAYNQDACDQFCSGKRNKKDCKEKIKGKENVLKLFSDYAPQIGESLATHCSYQVKWHVCALNILDNFLPGTKGLKHSKCTKNVEYKSWIEQLREDKALAAHNQAINAQHKAELVHDDRTNEFKAQQEEEIKEAIYLEAHPKWSDDSLTQEELDGQAES